MSEMNNLEKFLRERKQAEEQQKMFWESERDEYLNGLNALFAQIHEWLEPLANQGLISFSTSQVLVNEMRIGGYHAPMLIIQSGAQAVHFEPVGTEIIGAYGRVDMKGQKPITILWVPRSAVRPRVTVTIAPGPAGATKGETPKWTPPADRAWKIATSPPRITLIDLTSDELSAALMEALGG